MAAVKQANRSVGVTKSTHPNCSPCSGRALLAAPGFSWGQERGLLWARWVSGRTFLEWVCDRRGDLITLTHRGERGLWSSLHGAKGERGLKQRVWNILTVKICGGRAPVLLGAVLNSVWLSSDPQEGSAPGDLGAALCRVSAPTWLRCPPRAAQAGAGLGTAEQQELPSQDTAQGG